MILNILIILTTINMILIFTVWKTVRTEVEEQLHEYEVSGKIIIREEVNMWEVRDYLENSLDEPLYIKKIINSLNEYQLNRSGQIKDDT